MAYAAPMRHMSTPKPNDLETGKNLQPVESNSNNRMTEATNPSLPRPAFVCDTETDDSSVERAETLVSANSLGPRDRDDMHRSRPLHGEQRDDSVDGDKPTSGTDEFDSSKFPSGYLYRRIDDDMEKFAVSSRGLRAARGLIDFLTLVPLGISKSCLVQMISVGTEERSNLLGSHINDWHIVNGFPFRDPDRLDEAISLLDKHLLLDHVALHNQKELRLTDVAYDWSREQLHVVGMSAVWMQTVCILIPTEAHPSLEQRAADDKTLSRLRTTLLDIDIITLLIKDPIATLDKVVYLFLNVLCCTEADPRVFDLLRIIASFKVSADIFGSEVRLQVLLIKVLVDRGDFSTAADELLSLVDSRAFKGLRITLTNRLPSTLLDTCSWRRQRQRSWQYRSWRYLHEGRLAEAMLFLRLLTTYESGASLRNRYAARLSSGRLNVKGQKICRLDYDSPYPSFRTSVIEADLSWLSAGVKWTSARVPTNDYSRIYLLKMIAAAVSAVASRGAAEFEKVEELCCEIVREEKTQFHKVADDIADWQYNQSWAACKTGRFDKARKIQMSLREENSPNIINEHRSKVINDLRILIQGR
ncbi:Hypothetical protein D9617_14g076900 [Elsinoe fawcettii]|nr:Hypothetical protein D9617_14g076900 [Elsinoe fawcettii]